MTATAASWSTTVARSRGLPSIRIAIAALARPGPIAAAISLPVTGCGNSRRLPSGRVTSRHPRTAAGPSGAGDSKLSWGCSLIAPYAPSSSAVQTGRTGRKKPRPFGRRGRSGRGSAAESARATSRRPAIAGAGSRHCEDPAGCSHVLNIATQRLHVKPGARPDAPDRAVAPSLPARFNSLIAGFASLLGRINSLFVLISQYGGNHGAGSIAYASLSFD